MDHTPVVFKWHIATILCLSQLSLGISISAVTIAIPNMMASLGASLNQIQWVLTGYLITRTVLMPSVGWLGSRFKNRSLFILSAGAFTSTSFFCSISLDPNLLVFFRVLQAGSAGILYAISTAMMYESFAPQQRGTAIGLLNASFAMSFYVGPPIGGYLIEHMDWRAIFYVNALVGLVSMMGASFLFPQQATKKNRVEFDVLGFLTFTGGTVALLVGMSQGQEQGWSSPFIVFCFVSSTVLLCLFVFVELRTATPFLDLRCFQNMNFCITNLLNFCRVIGWRGANFLLSLFLQRALNRTPLQAGLLLLPGAVFQVFAPLAGILTDRLGPRIPTVAGFGILVFAAYGLSTVSAWSGVGFVLLSIILFSAGQSFLNTPLTTVALGSFPESQTKMATGLFSMTRGLGETFAVAVASLLLDRKTFFNASIMTPGQQAYLSEGERYNAYSRLESLLLKSGVYESSRQAQARSLLSYMLLKEAVARAYQDIFFLIAALYLLTMVIAALFLRSEKRDALPTSVGPAIPELSSAARKNSGGLKEGRAWI